MTRRVMIVQVRRNSDENINQELQWLGNSLGLFNLRDKDSSCFRIFIMLVKNARRGQGLSSDDISHHLELSRGTVVHHLSRLIDAGLIIHEKEGYLLRERTLEGVISHIQQDLENVLKELSAVAKEIDTRLG